VHERRDPGVEECRILVGVADLQDVPGVGGIEQMVILVEIARQLPRLRVEAVVARRQVLRLTGCETGNDGRPVRCGWDF
jgi:hypothetical protein